MIALILAWVDSYAKHLGFDVLRSDLAYDIRWRLSRMVWWAPYFLASGAVLARWVFPLTLLGTPKRFERLSEDQRERMLKNLQETQNLFLRASFFGIKTLALSCCYGRPQYLSSIGYPGRRP